MTGPSRELVSLPFCELIRHGSGSRWSFGFLFEYALSDKLSFQLRPSVDGHVGSLRETVTGDLLVAESPDVLRPVTVDQVLDFREYSVGLALVARRQLLPRLFLQGSIGLGHAFSVSQTYRQVAVEPANWLFGNNRREITLDSGALVPPPTLMLDVAAGLSYDLPISTRSMLSPEISLRFPIVDHAADGSWRDLTLLVGATLRFGIGGRQKPVADTPAVEPPRPDTPVVARPRPTLIPSMMTEPATVEVRINEYDSTEALPLLNQIYFAEGSDSIGARYTRLTPEQAQDFSNTNLTGSALDVYYNLLNIIGRRMLDAPRSALTINGYRSGGESDPGIARRRAERIKAYLVETWGIDPSRLKVVGGKLPPNPSAETTLQGRAENARAELIPSDPNITAPVLRRHIQRVATPPSVVFFPRAIAEAGVASWSIDVVEGERLWKRFAGVGKLPDSIRWNWRGDAGSLPTLPMHLSHSFGVTDSTGQSATTPLSSIDVAYHSRAETLEYRENDSTIESYSLLLFNFDSPKVSEGDRALLRAIAGNIRRQAVVRLTGYTDSLGGAEHNRELAMLRAGEVAKILRGLVPRGVTIVVDDKGGEKERFPYDTPEGRAHCRTVIIEVRTPVSAGS